MKNELKNKIEALGAKVNGIKFFDYATPTYKVSLSWEDYLKVRDFEIEGVAVKFCF